MSGNGKDRSGGSYNTSRFPPLFKKTGNGHTDLSLEEFEKLRPIVEPEKSEPEILRLELRYGMEAAEAPLFQDTVVHGVLHLGSISLIYGKPKSGKSFLATNLAIAVADDEMSWWMNQKIKQHGPVLYVACEGHGGFWKRLKAGGHVPDNFILAIGRPKLIANPDLKGYCWVPHPQDVELAIAQVLLRYRLEPILVVIDTVFRSFGGGDVNKSADMNAYVASAQAIADRGIAVLLVHHANKGNNLPSGSISLMGGADTLILVERDRAEETRTWQVEEAKDGAETGPRLFELEMVDDIMDAFGDPQSSCRVVDHGYKEAEEPKPRRGRAKEELKPEAEVQPEEPRTQRRSAAQDLMLRELEVLFATSGIPEPRPITPDGDPVPTVTRDQLRKRLEEQGHISRSEKTGQLEADSRVWMQRQLQALHRRGEAWVGTEWISLVTQNDKSLNLQRNTNVVDFQQRDFEDRPVSD